MNAFLKLLTDLFARARGVGNKMSPKKQNEIIKALEDSIDKVTAGTAKIDEQIAELKAIERQLDKADEIIAPLDNLIGDLSKKTGATPEETKRVLIDRYNEGYPPGDPKRMFPEDDDRLRAYIESQKLMGNEEDLMIDILENAELPSDQMAGITSLMDDIDVPPMPDETREIIESLTEMPATFKDLGKTDVGIGKPKGMIVTEETVDRAIDANKQRQRDLARAEELMMDMENFGKSFDEIMQMVQDEKVIPIDRSKKAEGGVISVDDLRTLNPGPRIPFASSEIPGSFEAQDEAMATREKYDSLSEEGKNLYNAYSLDNPGTDPNLIIDILQKQGFAFGGRVGLQDGGGPKIGRRGFLGLLGAGIGSLFMPKGVKQIAEAVVPAAKVIKQAPGMPDWFPLLVNQIKSKGKITREPDYKDFTSGGDTTVRYKLKDDSLSGGEIFLEEDLQSGTVSIFGRGDDGQQVSMDYFPGARTATKKGVKEDPPTFEAGEFFKGEIQDFENIGVPTDDLRGGLLSWEKLSGFNLTPREKIQRMMKKFEDDYKDPNVEPDDDIINMSQGGGVGSLFKQRNA